MVAMRRAMSAGGASSTPKKARRTRNWCDLPVDLLLSILLKLITPGDYARFRAVCKTWCSAAALLPPPLSVPNISVISLADGTWSLLSFLGDRLGLSPVRDGISSLLNGHCLCFGSSHGRLAICDSQYGFLMFDPRTGGATALPQPFFPGYMQLSESPETGLVEETYYRQPTNLNFCLLRHFAPTNFALSPGRVAFCYNACSKRLMCFRLGVDDAWNVSPFALPLLCSALHHGGRFYFLDTSFCAFVCDVGDTTTVHEIPTVGSSVDLLVNEAAARGLEDIRLVGCGEDVLMVVRTGSPGAPEEVNPLMSVFSVFRLEMGGGGRARWVEVRNIGRNALFLGPADNSFSLSARDYGGLEGNCIYLIECETWAAARHSMHDYVVYDIGDQSSKFVHCGGAEFPAEAVQSFWIPPPAI